jgi:cob(I)alamin adenosyltransferase
VKIYTKRGDKGATDLFGGGRVSKASQRVIAYGAIDAANSAIGFAASSSSLPRESLSRLHGIMSDMFDLGAELATAPRESAQDKLSAMLDNQVSMARIEELEKFIDEAESELPPLQSFVLPTGSDLASRFHLARVAVRQAEQEVVALQDSDASIREEVVAYLNRLSDLMFVWSRLYNHREGFGDVLWCAKKERSL